MINVLQSIVKVANKLQYVEIKEEKIQEYATSISSDDLKVSHIGLTKFDWTLEQLIELVFTFNVINYCFWAGKDSPKWTIEFEGKELDGSIALFRALEVKKKEDDSFTSGKYLANLSSHELAKILKGNIQISLFRERLEGLNISGKVLMSDFDGNWNNVLVKAKNNANILVEILANNFEPFNDSSLFKGEEIGFYKRAQLNSKMVSDALILKGHIGLENLEKLTAFADYKVPQILRSLGILNYSNVLASKINSLQIIEKDSEEENEIRIATIMSVERILEELSERFPDVTSSHVDSLLWNKSQSLKRDINPYHRTYTTAY